MNKYNIVVTKDKITEKAIEGKACIEYTFVDYLPDGIEIICSLRFFNGENIESAIPDMQLQVDKAIKNYATTHSTTDSNQE